MSHSHSIKSLQSQYGGNQRLFLAGGILLAHLCLIAFLLLLPQEALEESVPVPMVMVELQPPVPLSAGNFSTISQQPVTASAPSASLSRAAEEGGSTPVIPQSAPQAPTKMASVKPVSQAVITPVPSLAQPVTPVSASETALSASALGSQGGSTGNENAAAKSGTSITSTAPTSGGNGHASSPQYSAGYLSNPAPEYPSLARSMGEEGKVLLHVLVTSEGLAKKVKLHRTSGSDSLDDAAIRAVKKWRFLPARLGEQAMEAWVFVPIVFKLD